MNIEDYEQVDDRTLELFVSQKYHWNSLSTNKQRAMASELMRHRFLQKKYLHFINEVLTDKELFRKYRELLCGD
jgi:hypothetical protein